MQISSSNNMLKTAQNLIEKAGEKIGLSQNEIDLFIQPDRVIEVKVPIKTREGQIKTLVGYRSQHNNTLGP